MIKIDAIFLTVREAEYTSKKTNKLVQFKEVQTLIDGAICKWAFSNIAKVFPYEKLNQYKSGEEIGLIVEIAPNDYEKDKPVVVLVDVE